MLITELVIIYWQTLYHRNVAGRKLMVVLRTKEECVTESAAQTDLTMEDLADFESTADRRSRYQVEKQKKIREKNLARGSTIEKEKLEDTEATKRIEEWLKKPHTPPQQETQLTGNVQITIMIIINIFTYSR